MDFPDDDFDTTPAADDGEPDCPGGCGGRGCPDCGVFDLDQPAQQRYIAGQILLRRASAGTGLGAPTDGELAALAPGLTAAQADAIRALAATAEVRTVITWPDEADDPDEPVLPDLPVYWAQRGTWDDPQPIPLGPYRRVEDAMRHAEDDYRDHHDPRRLDELSWQVLAGYSDRVWLHAGRDGEKPEPTEWHVQTVTVAGAYDPQADG